MESGEENSSSPLANSHFRDEAVFLQHVKVISEGRENQEEFRHRQRLPLLLHRLEVEGEEMKIKKLSIGIRSVDQVMGDFAKAAKALERGEPVAKKESLYFADLRAFRRAVTDQRLAILRTIKERNPDSVYKLAKILQRDVKNVSADLSILEELGLVELRKTKTARGKVKPSVPYDSIHLNIAV